MNYIDLHFDLQCADDGNTTYFGGTFIARPSDAHADDSVEFYFKGNDRCESAMDQVVEHLMDWHGIDCPSGEEDDQSDECDGRWKIAEVIDKAIDRGESLRLYLDGMRKVTMVEPI